MSVFETGVRREVRDFGANPMDNLFITGDAAATLEQLETGFGGKVSLIYMDPPFFTGKKFEVRVKLGEEDWRRGRSSLTLPAYDDKYKPEEYLSFMKRVLTASKALLTDDGLIFVHIDWRMHAHIRLLMDEIFGEKNFINELIWTYETGGRAKNFFSRKHDIILMFAKSEEYDLHTEDVATARASKGSANHMRKQIDEDGRVYRTIKSAGKIYKYYDDEPVPPSDVWDDIAHLQQKDPQRTGYDTQKPLALLERIVKCASRPGDIVLDPFSGSGTTAEAAVKLGRRFIAIDNNPMCAEYVRRRTEGHSCTLEISPAKGNPLALVNVSSGLAHTEVAIDSFVLEKELPLAGGLDGVDSWGAGVYENGVYTELSCEIRTAKHPALKGTLDIPVTREHIMARISDITGRDFYLTL